MFVLHLCVLLPIKWQSTCGFSYSVRPNAMHDQRITKRDKIWTQVLLTCDTNYQWLTLHSQTKSSSHVTLTTSDSPCTVNSVRRSGSSAFSLFSISIVLKVRRPVYRHSWYHWGTGWKWTMLVSQGYTLHQNMITVCVAPPLHLCGKWSVYCKVPPQHLYWGTDKISGILWTSEDFVWRGHDLYFGFNPTVSKGFE